MQLVTDGLDIIVFLSIVIIQILLALWLAKAFSCTRRRSLALYTWHSFFSLLYAVFVISNGGDALAYYSASFGTELRFGLGTSAVNVLASLFSQGLGFSFLGLSFVFGFFGFIGLIAFDAALRSVTQYKKQKTQSVATILVFLPSVSFWSSGLGKDSISFMAMGLMLWASLSIHRRYLVLLVAALAMLFVRPHMAGIMVMALAFSLVINKKTPILQRSVIGAGAMAASAVLIPFGLQYAGVDDSSNPESVMEYIEERQGHNLDGGSSLDISSMSLPMQLVTYLIRPLPFEAHNFFALLASMDNVILLVMLLASIKPLFFKKLPHELQAHNRTFLWVYVFVSWAILSMTTANLGIAMRQKWMFVPVLMFLLISLMGKRKTHA